jgi:uncharacterized protein YhhL (DUF1145 family)
MMLCGNANVGLICEFARICAKVRYWRVIILMNLDFPFSVALTEVYAALRGFLIRVFAFVVLVIEKDMCDADPIHRLSVGWS